MAKKTIAFSVTEEEKSFLDNYAKSRGVNTASALSRIALFEYIRRRSPKELTALMHLQHKKD